MKNISDQSGSAGSITTSSDASPKSGFQRAIGITTETQSVTHITADRPRVVGSSADNKTIAVRMVPPPPRKSDSGNTTT